MIYPFNGLEISWKRKEIVQDQFARLVNSRFEEYTYKKRTHQTRDAFLEALLPHDYPQEQIHYINYTKCEDVFDSEGHVNPEAFDKYSSLRFFSICPVNLIQIDDM